MVQLEKDLPCCKGCSCVRSAATESPCGIRAMAAFYPTYDCHGLRRDGFSTKSCVSIRCDVLDAAISRRVLEVIQPAELEIAIEAMKQLERQNEAVSRQRQMQIERAEYETELAQRRYEEVDPANRLVASTLERRWNDALVKVEELRARGVDASLQQKEPLKVAAGQRAKVLGLTRDFPRLWSDPSTSSKDKTTFGFHVILRTK